MPENTIVGFKNTKDYPISIDVRFNKRAFKFTLWRDQQFADREGNPLIPDKEEWPRLLRLGIKPIYSNVVAASESSMPRTEIILDDAALMEAKAKAAVEPPKIEEFTAPFLDEAVDPESTPVNHLERKDNPNPGKADLVWQDGDGLWIFNKNGIQNLNPAKIKSHIKKTFGEDYLDKVEWLQYTPKSVSDK